SLLGCVIELLISTAGGRFPRAWLEPPCASHYGVSRLMHSGVAAFRSNQLVSALYFLLRRGIIWPSKWNMRDHARILKTFSYLYQVGFVTLLRLLLSVQAFAF